MGEKLGRYVVLDRVGAGGMGVVYAAYDPELDRRVAVKLLHPGGDGESGRARLLREAQTMARLTHPNVVTVHDAGTIDDQVFVAMEFIDGETLKQWMHAKTRPWREVLATLLPAGRGLAAAHAAGLVHRDFKPDNVMIARDGRVVVMDFGLARPSEGDDTPTETLGEVRRAPVGSLTETGAVLGTPAYMAPEQHLGKEAGPAADQFAFAVTLYEALQGQRPFLPAAGDDVPTSLALGAEILAGRVRPGPRDGELPPRLRRAVMRGLADDPAARWPSMQAMLDELDAIARPRRWSLGVAAAGVVIAGGAVAFAATRSGGTAAAASPCLGAEARLAGVWDDAARAHVAEAFRASGAAVADHSVAAVTRTLDAYFAAWVAQRTSACEDTRRGQQSGELLDRRMLCLDSRFAEARALVEIFARADVDIVNQSVRAASGLTPLADCADRASLGALVPLPRDPAVRADVDRTSERLAAARALRSAGEWKDALAHVKEIVVTANALRHDPLIAEAVYEQANLEYKTGDNVASEADLLVALVAADRGHDDHTRAKALLQLVHVVGTLGRRFKEAHIYARMAEGAIARLGDPPGLRADLLEHHGNVTSFEDPASGIPMMTEALALREKAFGPDEPETAMARSALGSALYQADRYDEARVQLEQARAQIIRALGDQHPSLAYTLMSLGNVAVQQGKLDDAQAHYEQALAIRERAMGPDSPALGGLVHNLTNILFQREHYAEALPMERRALALMEKQYGADNPILGSPLTQLGEILIGLDDPAGAVPFLERALRLRAAEGIPPSELARTEFRLADALWDSHGDRRRARTLATSARDRWTKAGAKRAVDMASKWLAERR